MKIKGSVSSYKDALQIRLDYITLPSQEDHVHITDFIPSAPLHPADMMFRIKETIDQMKNKEIQSIVKSIVEDKEIDLMKYPAAKKFITQSMVD